MNPRSRDQSQSMSPSNPDAFSFQAPVSQNREANVPSTFRLVGIDELGPAEPVEYLWAPFIARGAITLLTGLWKAGKTTLLTHLLRDIGRGEGLVTAPTLSPIIIVSEEPRSIWARRRDELALPNTIMLPVMNSNARPDRRGWLTFISEIAQEVRRLQAGLVVIDTIASFWPVREENDASDVMDALMPLRDITATGAGLLICHHPPKGGATQNGTASRGSGALPGFADILVTLTRFSGEDDLADRRRLLVCASRLDEVEPETVVELTDVGYVVRGERAAIIKEDMDRDIWAVLPAGGVGLTAEEVKAEMGHKAIGITKLRGRLENGNRLARWKRSGTGMKGDPFRYFKTKDGDADLLHGHRTQGVETKTQIPGGFGLDESTPPGGWA